MQQYDDGAYVEFFAVKDGVRYNARIVKLKDLMMALTTANINTTETVFKDIVAKEG